MQMIREYISLTHNEGVGTESSGRVPMRFEDSSARKLACWLAPSALNLGGHGKVNSLIGTRSPFGDQSTMQSPLRED